MLSVTNLMALVRRRLCKRNFLRRLVNKCMSKLRSQEMSRRCEVLNGLFHCKLRESPSMTVKGAFYVHHEQIAL